MSSVDTTLLYCDVYHSKVNFIPIKWLTYMTSLRLKLVSQRWKELDQSPSHMRFHRFIHIAATKE